MKSKIYFLQWTLFLAVTTGCRTTPNSEPKNFFENSIRRDSNDDEINMVVKVNSCTGFFLKNSANKAYIMSAQHCFNHDPIEACPTMNINASDGKTYKCLKVIIGIQKEDPFIFETDVPTIVANLHPLILLRQTPKINTPLVMIGFPIDEDPVNPRRGKVTTTEGCWIDSLDYHPVMIQRYPLGSFVSHNCSTYAGNSGGPMIWKGFNYVVGLPANYLPNDFNRYSSQLTKLAHIYTLESFVHNHSAELINNQIAVYPEIESR